jgi:hypothetical protein
MHFGHSRGPASEPGEGSPAGLPPVERLRVAADRRPTQPLVIGDALDVPLERIGRGRKVRGSLVAIGGAVFITGAVLLSAFGYGGSSRVAPSRATSAAVASPVSHPRGPAAGQVPTPPPPWYDRAWQTVDWSAIAIPDGHSGWGVATASMPLTITAHPTTPAPQPEIPAPRPQIRWAAIQSPAEPAVVKLASDRRVYAFAITWPQGIAVDRVTVDYLGSPNDPPYVSALDAFTAISPLSAAAVVETPAPPLPTAPTRTAAVASGQFWVPPMIVSPFGDPAAPGSSWRFLPWPWPMGAYKVTITARSGSNTLVLSLEETA